MIKHLQSIFGSRTKALEVLYLLHDLKPVVRQGFYPRELEKVEKFCVEHGLVVEKSPYKVVLDGEEMFTNKGKVVSPDDTHGMFLVYMGKDQFKVLWACLYETKQDHYNTGLTLGYPECCARFFAEEFGKGNLNPMHQPTNPWTNMMLREQDVVLLSHFPCRSDCEQSVEMAKKNFEIIKKCDKALADLYHQKLGAPLGACT